MSRFVYIVDDEEAVRHSLRHLLSTWENLLIVPFVSGDAFLESCAEREPGVLLLDIHMPGRTGIKILEHLAKAKRPFETIVITGQGDIPLAVEAMRLGAVDFLEKPFNHHTLFTALEMAFDQLDQSQEGWKRSEDARNRLEKLSERERGILDQLVAGRPNKMIASLFGISVRTVEVHRSSIMTKLAVKSLPDAIKLVFSAN